MIRNIDLFGAQAGGNDKYLCQKIEKVLSSADKFCINKEDFCISIINFFRRKFSRLALSGSPLSSLD